MRANKYKSVKIKIIWQSIQQWQHPDISLYNAAGNRVLKNVLADYIQHVSPQWKWLSHYFFIPPIIIFVRAAELKGSIV